MINYLLRGAGNDGSKSSDILSVRAEKGRGEEEAFVRGVRWQDGDGMVEFSLGEQTAGEIGDDGTFAAWTGAEGVAAICRVEDQLVVRRIYISERERLQLLHRRDVGASEERGFAEDGSIDVMLLCRFKKQVRGWTLKNRFLKWGRFGLSAVCCDVIQN